MVLREPCPQRYRSKNTSAGVLVTQISGTLIELHLGGLGAER